MKSRILAANVYFEIELVLAPEKYLFNFTHLLRLIGLGVLQFSTMTTYISIPRTQ